MAKFIIMLKLYKNTYILITMDVRFLMIRYYQVLALVIILKLIKLFRVLLQISKQFSKKNSLQCFSRYKRIRPGIVKGSWKREEDIKIIELVAKYGKAWSKISKTLGTRNGKQIRDRYINVLDPEIKKGKFTEEEDNMLINLYYKHGPKWATIAKYYNNRTADMVKNRFHSSIKKRLGLDTSDRTGKVS